MTQVIGKISVSNSGGQGSISSNVSSINVRVNTQQAETVRSISYGNRELKNSTDLSFVGAENGDAIVYQANTNTFIVAPLDAAAIKTVDGGLF